ncbi:MAG: putative DNA-binding domain-containing protein [Xanthomonadales bacterium]|jgi:hypothetical protein|nr:putative DNA-binding domain-containing protein [Xanthomonadales bacterium]
MPAAPDTLRAQQLQLAHWIRDPATHVPPPGLKPERLAVYRELVRNNIEGLLAAQFPVIRGLRGDTLWNALVDDFLREHRAKTPLFTEIGLEFVDYLAARAESDRGDPPFLPELAHYEWAELGLELAEDTIDPAGIDPDGDLLAGVPVLSPLAWPLAYQWPVDRIRPDFQPDTPPAAPTLLLLHRDASGHVRFARMDPLGYSLLAALREAPASGHALVQRLAESGGLDAATLIGPAAALLADLRRREVLLGVRG